MHIQKQAYIVKQTELETACNRWDDQITKTASFISWYNAFAIKNNNRYVSLNNVVPLV